MLQWAPRKAIASILPAGLAAVGGRAAIAADPVTIQIGDLIARIKGKN